MRIGKIVVSQLNGNFFGCRRNIKLLARNLSSLLYSRIEPHTAPHNRCYLLSVGILSYWLRKFGFNHNFISLYDEDSPKLL